MFEELNKNIDLAVNESEKPVLIIGNPGDGKVTHLRETFKTTIVPLSNVNRYSMFENDLVSNIGDLTQLPTWYSDFLVLCEQNQSEKCLVVFDDIEKATEDVIATLQSIVSNENGKFNLPANANIVCTMNGLAPTLPENFLQGFTVLNAQDKDNIEIKWNSDVQKS